MAYFNYSVHMVPAEEASYWRRREFLRAWWTLYSQDRRWTPPAYRLFTRELQPVHNPHLARLQPLLIHVDALHRTGLGPSQQDQPVPLMDILERPLAAAVALRDPRRQDQTGYLALLHAVNDPEAVEHLLDAVRDVFRRHGIRRILVPVGLSPYSHSGVQADGWDLGPPIGAPSNPPYVPDLLERFFRPIHTGVVYQVELPATIAPAPGPTLLAPLDPQRLAADLLPLFSTVLTNPTLDFPPPDEAEAAFLLRGVEASAPEGWVAEQDGRPVGFVLLGSDNAEMLRRSGGGRRLVWQTWLALRDAALSGTSDHTGRLFFGGVIPEWQGRGVGQQLWQAALQTALERGWTGLTIGPVWTENGRAFLANQRATPIQTAHLLELSL